MTISFGHNDGEWKSKYSFTPKSIINSATSLFSRADDVDIHEHNKGEINTFYDTQSPSLLGVAFNDNPSSNKIFKTISIEGSEPIVQKLHNFAPKKSTDSPSSNNFVSTTEGEVKGGIIYHGLERSSDLRNGASMHYVGEITDILPNNNVEGLLSVNVDNSSSDYIPSYDAVYGIYLPDSNEFYFGESQGTQQGLNLCDIVNLLVLTDSYDVSTGVDADGVIDSVTVSIPVIPDTDPSNISVRAVRGQGEIEGLLNEQTESFYSWTIQLPDISVRFGNWTIQIIPDNTSEDPPVSCDPVDLQTISIQPPKPQDEEEEEEVISCQDFVNQNFDVQFGWIEDQEISDQYVPNSGAMIVSFSEDIGTPPIGAVLVEEESGLTLIGNTASGVSATWTDIPDGRYRFYVYDSNPSPDDLSQAFIDGVVGCIYESDIYSFEFEPPEILPPTCEEVRDYVFDNASVFSTLPTPTSYQINVEIPFNEDFTSRFEDFEVWKFSGIGFDSLGGSLPLVDESGNPALNAFFVPAENYLALDGEGLNVTYSLASYFIVGGPPPDGNYFLKLFLNDGSNQPCPTVLLPLTLSDGGLTVTIQGETDETAPRFGSTWPGRLQDTNYSGDVGVSDLLDLLSAFGQTTTPSGPFDPVYGVHAQSAAGSFVSDSNYDASVNVGDLLNVLSTYGTTDENHLGPGSVKYPDLGTDLQAYVGPDDLINPAYFFDSNGELIPGAPDPRDYGPVEGSVEFFQQNQRDSQSEIASRDTSGRVSFNDLKNLDGMTPALTPPQEGTFPAVNPGVPSEYFIQTLSSSALNFLLGNSEESFPSNAQLYAFKNTEVYGDDLRGQTSEMLMDLGSEDFELFAVNLNYELVNADHTR